MNIYRQEFKAFLKSAIIWALSMSALALLFLSIYPTIASDAADFKEILSNYPATVREMLGINLDFITSLLGLYTMTFSFILLCGAIQAMNLGVSILSRESRERTADFLLVKPVARTKIVTAKLGASITVLLLTNAIYFVISFLSANLFKTEPFSQKVFFLINLSMLFLQLIFLAIGMFISVFFQRIKNVLPISLGVVFGFYMIGAVLATGADGESKRFLSPFHYFNSAYIIEHSGFEVSYLLLSIIIILVCIITGYIVYNKRDIHAV